MKKIKIAIPKSGRLHNETIKCFAEAGFKFVKDNTRENNFLNKLNVQSKINKRRYDLSWKN